MDKYIYMTVYQFADAIASAPWGTEFNFTYDTESSIYEEPTGWYCMKVIRLFDEEDGVLCYGYYGGGCTRCIDMYIISDDTYNVRENQKAIENQFRKWSKFAYDELGDTVCVEVTDDNRQWIEDVV